MTLSDEIERLDGLYAAELKIMDALDAAHQRGQMEYLHYAPARDVTYARAAAISFAAASLRARTEEKGHG